MSGPPRGGPTAPSSAVEVGGAAAPPGATSPSPALLVVKIHCPYHSVTASQLQLQLLSYSYSTTKLQLHSYSKTVTVT